MIDPRVPVLRKRLAELDFTVPPAGPVADLYDEPLVGVVKSYQEMKGLTVDGVIGAKTVRSLNTTIDERIEQIVANLERRRWLPEDLGSRFVYVNTGDYSMLFVNEGKVAFQSQVIVGTPKDPTPEIQSTMRGFQTNPYWTVPPSIAGEEYLPILRRDPNALAGSGFKIFASWSHDDEIDPNTIDWSSIHPKAFPYRIRQDSGASNALATSSSRSTTSTGSTCTTRRAAGCSPREAATSAMAVSACRTRWTSSRRSSTARTASARIESSR